MNSRSKSDSNGTDLYVGPNDLDLMKRLCAAGTEHRKFMRMIVVYMDLTAPLFLWRQLDTYKIGTVANSCSTMHKLHSKPITIEDFSTDHLDPDAELVFEDYIEFIERKRQEYLETKDKSTWYELTELLPTSYLQKRTLMINYEVALNMIRQRSNHKLDEWKQFTEILKDLPYMREFI